MKLGPQFSEHAGVAHARDPHNVQVREPAAQKGLEAVAGRPAGRTAVRQKARQSWRKRCRSTCLNRSRTICVYGESIRAAIPGRIGLQPLPEGCFVGCARTGRRRPGAVIRKRTVTDQPRHSKKSAARSTLRVGS